MFARSYLFAHTRARKQPAVCTDERGGRAAEIDFDL